MGKKKNYLKVVTDKENMEKKKIPPPLHLSYHLHGHSFDFSKQYPTQLLTLSIAPLMTTF